MVRTVEFSVVKTVFYRIKRGTLECFERIKEKRNVKVPVAEQVMQKKCIGIAPAGLKELPSLRK